MSTTVTSSIPPRPTVIPPVLRQAKTVDRYRELLLGLGIEDPNEAKLAFLVMNLVSGAVSPEAFLTKMAASFSLTSTQVQEMTNHIVDEILTPMEKDLPFSLLELKGKPSAFVEPDFSKEESEASKITQDKAAILETKEPLDIPGIVKEICGNPAFQFTDPQLQERCVKLIESRVRDVRTPEQTRAQLEKTIDKGGLGVTGRRLSDMLATIEGRVAAYQGNLAQEQQRKRIEKQSRLPDKAALAKKEEALLTKKYVELTGKVPDTHVAPAAPCVSRTSVAISAHHEQLVREGKIDAGKVKQVVQDAQHSAAASRVRTTASMQEVTFEKRLSGPVDELRSLTLTDFRRLSKDSFAAATKIKDKVESLEDQGYDKKVEAVQAWRSSPLNQMYVAITRDAVLLGVSVVEILDKKRTAGEDLLTDEELKAVMKLNAELRF